MHVLDELGTDEWVVPFVQAVLLHAKMESATKVHIVDYNVNRIHFYVETPYLTDEDEEGSENIRHRILSTEDEDEEGSKNIVYGIPDTEAGNIYDDGEVCEKKLYWTRYWIDEEDWGTYSVSYSLYTDSENNSGLQLDAGAFRITHSGNITTLLWTD